MPSGSLASKAVSLSMSAVVTQIFVLCNRVRQFLCLVLRRLHPYSLSEHEAFAVASRFESLRSTTRPRSRSGDATQQPLHHCPFRFAGATARNQYRHAASQVAASAITHHRSFRVTRPVLNVPNSTALRRRAPMGCFHKCDHHASEYSQDAITFEKWVLFNQHPVTRVPLTSHQEWGLSYADHYRIHECATGVLLPPRKLALMTVTTPRTQSTRLRVPALHSKGTVSPSPHVTIPLPHSISANHHILYRRVGIHIIRRARRRVAQPCPE